MASFAASATPAPIRYFALGLGLAMLPACSGGGTAGNNGSAAAAPAGATPVRSALAEFDRVCSRAQEREAYLAAAPGAGWEPHQPAADSPLGRVIALGEAAAREVSTQLGRPGEARVENSVYRKTANGRELFLLVSQIQVPGMQRSLECRVYDFNAPAPTEAEITAWTTTRANNRVNEQGLNAYGWQPGFRQGFSRIDVTHVDTASPLRAQIPISGLSITAFQGPTTAE